MITRIVLLSLGAALLFGCSTVRSVGTADEQQTSFSDVNRSVRGKVVQITFTDGRKIKVVDLQVAPDSISFLDHRANRLTSIATSDIYEISIVKAGRGALAGLFLGALVGAGVGTYRALSQGDDDPNDPIGKTRDEKLKLYPQAHALYFALIGTPIGAMIGGKKIYRFIAPSNVDEVLSTSPMNRE